MVEIDKDFPHESSLESHSKHSVQLFSCTHNLSGCVSIAGLEKDYD